MQTPSAQFGNHCIFCNIYAYSLSFLLKAFDFREIHFNVHCKVINKFITPVSVFINMLANSIIQIKQIFICTSKNSLLSILNIINNFNYYFFISFFNISIITPYRKTNINRTNPTLILLQSNILRLYHILPFLSQIITYTDRVKVSGI